MKYLESLLFSLFPRLLVSSTPWSDLWLEQERNEFLLINRVFFPLACVGYILHYYLVDIPEGLTPQSLWFTYRFSMAGLALACFLFYLIPSLYTIRSYRWPSVIACATFCYLQAKTVVWYPEVPYLYAFAYVFVSAQVIRTTMLNSLLFAVGVMALQWPALSSTSVSPAVMYSAALVTVVTIILTRSSYLSQVKVFISQHENIDMHKKMIEANVEFTDRIKSFLPKEISLRMEQFLTEDRMPVLKVMQKVLTPRKMQVACLFSDIRGFTQGSKDLDGFLKKGVLPDVRACTAAVEQHHGIPRKVGDLIFAYYDERDNRLNLLRSILTGFEMVELNKSLNKDLNHKEKVKRYILISVGEAVVGNLGGFSSSIEITALGTPVNLLSRIDELTKDKRLASSLSSDDLVLSNAAAKAVMSLVDKIEVESVDLAEVEVSVRDFPDEQFIWKMPVTAEQRRRVLEGLRNIEKALAKPISYLGSQGDFEEESVA